MDPFNENAKRMIDSLSSGTTVSLYKPTGDKKWDVADDPVTVKAKLAEVIAKLNEADKLL